MYRQAADEFRDQAEVQQVFGLHLVHEVLVCLRLPGGFLGCSKSESIAAQAPSHDVLHPHESSSTYEEDTLGVDLDVILLGMLATALGRNIADGAFQDLEESLLDALSGDVAGDADILGLAPDLVDLVDIDDAPLSLLDIEIGGLQQPKDDVLDIFADVTGFRQGGGVHDAEGDIQYAGEGAGEESLPGSGGTEKKDVRFFYFDIGELLGGEGCVLMEALVVIVDGYGEDLLGLVLPDHVFVQQLADLHRGGSLDALGKGRVEVGLVLSGKFLFEDGRAHLDALVADVYSRARNQLFHLRVAFATEGTHREVGCSGHYLNEAGMRRARGEHSSLAGKFSRKAAFSPPFFQEPEDSSSSPSSLRFSRTRSTRP